MISKIITQKIIHKQAYQFLEMRGLFIFFGSYKKIVAIIRGILLKWVIGDDNN